MTPRGRQALDFILAYRKEHGFSPSHREIAKGLGTSSVSNTYRIVSQLVDEGYLIKGNGGKRSLIPVEEVNQNIAAMPEWQSLRINLKLYNEKKIDSTTAMHSIEGPLTRLLGAAFKPGASS